VAIGKVLLQLMDARTFGRNHDGIKTGYTKDVPLIELAKLAGVEPRAYLVQAARRAIRNPRTARLARDLK
jgi:hypothetical protein